MRGTRRRGKEDAEEEDCEDEENAKIKIEKVGNVSHY